MGCPYGLEVKKPDIVTGFSQRLSSASPVPERGAVVCGLIVCLQGLLRYGWLPLDRS
jgi:hypothetical protein